MGLSSAMYAGISDLSVHSEQLTVISNNLANVNTVGFKGARMDFEDVMSQDYPTSAGIAQIGRGVRVAAIFNDFSQGAFETTSESTDMAISGNGFFVFRVKGEEVQYYTRAGNFRFDSDGYLVDPHGYVLQGWAIEQENASAASQQSSTTTTGGRIVGVPTDIRLKNFQSAPKVTSNITVVTNLDPTTISSSNSSTNPYFAMFENWDGMEATPLDEGLYAYSSSIKVYDQIGTAHTLTIYYDQVTLSDAGGYTVWEYMVTSEPSEDGRIFNGSHIGETSAAGVMMIGTMTFRSGQLVGQSAFTLKSDAGGNVKNLSAWSLATLSTGGYAVFTPNFLSQSNASLDDGVNALPIEVNFGLRNTDLTSNGGGSITRGWASSGTLALNAAAVGNNVTNVSLIRPRIR